MSGIKTGTRLEQLRALERKVRHEIDSELRRLAVDGPHEVRDINPMCDRPVSRPEPAVVRDWLREHGFPVSARGTISGALMAEYLDAHPLERAP